MTEHDWEGRGAETREGGWHEEQEEEPRNREPDCSNPIWRPECRSQPNTARHYPPAGGT